MCKSADQTGGPKRCSGDARTGFARSQQVVEVLCEREEELQQAYHDPDAEHELWLETRYSESIAAEDAYERSRGAVDFEDAWDAADPVHAAGRPLRHAERQAYEEHLAAAMRHGYNQSLGDTLDDESIDRRVDEILAEQGLSRAVVEQRMSAAAAPPPPAAKAPAAENSVFGTGTQSRSPQCFFCDMPTTNAAHITRHGKVCCQQCWPDIRLTNSPGGGL